jgi:hypothetical protein
MCEKKKEFKAMNKMEKKQRIDFLWRKLRRAVSGRRLLKALSREREKKAYENFGI